jgi:hypothetical protein
VGHTLLNELKRILRKPIACLEAADAQEWQLDALRFALRVHRGAPALLVLASRAAGNNKGRGMARTLFSR